MPENPGIPPLFRDIFKNAYLPYRDPETLRAFLKIIDEFTYEHSERLGDAFEYLLSVLGSQGDAGQFRTPRHIIDFMVEVIDPACGTAGFLISSYKHILKANTSTPSPTGRGSGVRDGNLLTPDEKGRLAKNFKGYDISPDMVRLSLVNLYLHGFTNPHIYEYDTLTSEEKWNEYADVILANPPFMSPKGGIKPHKRFSVRSKRSEVLFVDYMAEHLTPSGRAGIIVPEGIIFQSQNAYKQLRKMLVEEYLVAVVSLPAGVFNPYSGVKTSILILDKSLAKQSDTIAFFKVENDGFNLGTQRRKIEKNDLPQVTAAIAGYLGSLRARESVGECEPTLGLIIPKYKIAENGDYNLSGERYREKGAKHTCFPRVALGNLCEFLTDGDWIERKDQAPNGIRLIQTGNVGIGKYLDKPSNARFISEETFTRLRCTEIFEGDILVSRLPDPVGRACMVPRLPNRAITAVDCSILRFDPKRFIARLFPYYTQLDAYYEQLNRYLTGASRRRISRKNLEAVQIPLPPLDMQKEIVAEIDGYQKVIDGARAVLDNYRLHITIHPDWPMEPLSDHFATMSGGTPSKAEPAFWSGHIPWVSPKDMKANLIEDTEDHISEAAIEASSTKLIPAGSLVCVVRSGILKHSFPVALLARDMCINQDLIAFHPTSGAVSSKFLFYVLKTKAASILETGIKPGVTVQSFYNGYLRDYRIPVPTSATQQGIVAEIEAEQALANANRKLIERMEKKIQATLARVWGKDESPTVEA
jgi:type I restriction enzyme M protein